jgi:hypothetical protein
MLPEKAYEKLSEFIDVKDPQIQNRNIKAFLKATELKQEDMLVKLIFDKAVRDRVITQKNKIYRRGETIIGNNYEEAVENLASVEMSGELNSLMKEVNWK